jgi:hypothetical protein
VIVRKCCTVVGSKKEQCSVAATVRERRTANILIAQSTYARVLSLSACTLLYCARKRCKRGHCVHTAAVCSSLINCTSFCTLPMLINAMNTASTLTCMGVTGHRGQEVPHCLTLSRTVLHTTATCSSSSGSSSSSSAHYSSATTHSVADDTTASSSASTSVCYTVAPVSPLFQQACVNGFQCTSYLQLQ